jgi:hypothetical protein
MGVRIEFVDLVRDVSRMSLPRYIASGCRRGAHIPRRAERAQARFVLNQNGRPFGEKIRQRGVRSPRLHPL